MTKAKINIPLDFSDRVLEVLGWIGAGLLIFLPIYYYADLPEIIPQHFDVNGNPDGFGSKGILWFLPIIGVVTYVGLAIINKYPHTFNYLHKITAENAERSYTNATKMIRVLNTSIVCFFTLITYFTIQIALGNATQIPPYYLYGFLCLILGIVGYYVIKSTKEK